MSAVTGLPDKPLEDPGEDFLDRRTFANAIAEQILSAPKGQSLRIGVYGGWGEGKTSVLNLIRKRLKAEKQFCVWITPWASGQRTDVLRELVLKLNDELQINDKVLTTLDKVSGWGAKASPAAKAMLEKGTPFWTAGAAELIGPIVSSVFGATKSATAKRFFVAVQEKLADRKLIVFIDDIDRVKPDLVPELLLSLREALDQPNFYYVMALAPDVVEEALKSVHTGWRSAGQFLEKIIEYPRYLPIPTEYQLGELLTRAVTLISGSVDETTLRSLAPLMSPNPRKIKLFLRFLASLNGMMKRFNTSEIDLRLFYLTQLLRCEFPEATQRMVENEVTMEDLERGHIIDYAKKLSGKMTAVPAAQQPTTTSSKVDPEHLLDSDADQALRKRFLQLYDALRNRQVFVRGVYSIRRLFTLPDEPPVKTWNEMNEFLARYDAAPSPERSAMVSGLLKEGEPVKVRAAAIFDLLIEMRQNALTHAAIEAKLHADMKSALQEVDTITDILEAFVTEEKAFEVPLLPLSSWEFLVEHLGKWSHFTKLDHEQLRAREAKLIAKSVDLMTDDLRLSALTFLEKSRWDITTGAAFNNLMRNVHEQLRTWAARHILSTFARPDGLEAYWGDAEVGLKAVLFTPDSPLFSNADLRSEFLTLADSRTASGVIQANFLQFVRMVLYGATEGGSFGRKNCQEILQDKEIMKRVWTAAISTPLNPSSVGALREQLKKLKAIGLPGVDEMFPAPDWWKALESVFFTKQDDEAHEAPLAEPSEKPNS